MQSASKWAFATTITSVAAAFFAAGITANTGIMSLTPPPTDAMPNPTPDVSDPVVLHQAAFTAWAAAALSLPAFVAFPLRGLFDTAARIWLPFWTGAYAAFLVHMLWSMGVFFGWDYDWMRNTSRVSAFWPGILVLFWWPLDIWLAWRGKSGNLVRAQRVVLTLVLFILFVGGSAVMGELTLIRVLGLGLVAAMAVSLVLRAVHIRNSDRSVGTYTGVS